MKFIDMFGGIGGFSLGLERNGHECVGYYEWDKYAVEVYNRRFGTKYRTTDITKLDAKEVPDHDILCAGFPCQAFSIAGKREGFKDIRGTLFAEIVRIAKEKKPRILFLENVKGLLNHDRGETFATILHEISKLGYRLEWEVINSKNFGVPQNRERVFIIGHLGEGRGREVFPIGTNEELFNETRKRQQKSKKRIQSKDISSTIDSRYGTLRSAGETYILSHYPRSGNPKKGGTGRLTSKEHSFTVDRFPHYVTRQPLRFLTRNQKNIEGDYSFTVDGGQTGGVKINQRVRRLTPVECERLQGFPDNWTEGHSDTKRYKMLGNAVTVNVIEEIAKRLIS